MNRTFTLLLAVLLCTSANSQTTVYETGQIAGDAWTGWSTPTTSNCSGSVNGANIYQFTGSNGATYSFELYRQFTISSNDIDIYLAASTQNATVSVEYSSDNVSYSQIGSQNWGSGYSQSTLVIPTYDPGVSTFYLKIVVSGTFGSPSNTQLNTFSIDAELSSTVDEMELGSDILYSNGMLQLHTTMQDYTINIYDLGGKLIKTEQNMKTFDFNGYHKGLYFVNVVNREGEQKTFKISHN